MFIGGLKQLLAKGASSYRGNIEHYRGRLVQDDVDLLRHGFIHYAASSALREGPSLMTGIGQHRTDPPLAKPTNLGLNIRRNVPSYQRPHCSILDYLSALKWLGRCTKENRRGSF